ncbi:MAG: hypothetical protein JJE13_10325 [Thermoleophilia bacterium]|nr:hypothetical protein [Thermoleophilia bacterium]
MIPKQAKPWLLAGVLAVAVAGMAGFALGSSSATDSSDAEIARNDAYEVAYDQTVDEVEAIAEGQGLKSGKARGRRAGVKTGGREGFDIGGGIAGIEDAKADAGAAAAEQAAAESAIAERQANCGAIPEAPDICPTSAELAEYQAAAAAAIFYPAEGGPTDDEQ